MSKWRRSSRVKVAQDTPSRSPTVRFYGDPSEGFRAFASVFGKYGLRVKDLRRVWRVEDGELTGPRWELVFRPQHSPEGPTQ